MHRIKLIKILLHCFLIFFASIYFIGCPSQKPVQNIQTPEPAPEPPRKFALTLGSIDISRIKKKIEATDIRKFALRIKNDSLDILAVQGITRYPELKNRIDVFNELTKSTEMASVFGETINLSGRQTGNGIFSNYPVKSHESSVYENISSIRFESALQAIIDCGERELVIVSTQLPEKMTQGDKAIIISKIGKMPVLYNNRPVIVGGNLLSTSTANLPSHYKSVEHENTLQKFWYSNDGSIEFIKSKVMQTTLGEMLLVQFKVNAQVYP